jgi:ABC-type dipeptide/oligopeptide/nickel transport system permease component
VFDKGVQGFMTQFLIKRLIGLIFVLIGVTFITFIIGYAAPGDPIQAMLGPHFNMATYLRLKHLYGLDLPWYQQYFNYVINLLHGNLGTSFSTQGRPVWDILKDGVPTSLELGFWGLVIELGVGVPLGIAAALYAGKWFDSLPKAYLNALSSIGTPYATRSFRSSLS